MQLIKLDATDSTNDYLKSLMGSVDLADFTVVVAEQQLKGRGQMGAKWQSEAGKNLTFSILKNNLDLPISDCFLLNICVSIAIYNSLKDLRVTDLYIKWPNDILSGASKICGVLIENTLSGSRVNTSVIGIGLNVNQLDFGALQNVSSLKLLMGRTFNLEDILLQIVKNLKLVFHDLKETGPNSLRQSYESALFRKDKPSSFEGKNARLFKGIIRGVSKNGKLVVALEDDMTKEFDLKEIKLLY